MFNTISVKPEYIIPTFGTYVLDMDLYDCRLVQVGGTLPAKVRGEEYSTALYFKCKSYENEDSVSYVKVNIPPAYKAFIITSGGGRHLNEQDKLEVDGITFIVLCDAMLPLPTQGSDENYMTIFQTSGSGVYVENVISGLSGLEASLASYGVTFSIENEPKGNPTPFD